MFLFDKEAFLCSNGKRIGKVVSFSIQEPRGSGLSEALCYEIPEMVSNSDALFGI